MTPELIITAIAVVGLVVVAAGALALNALTAKRDNEDRRAFIAQCDERIALYYSHAEREKSRYFATLFPDTHKLYRDHSGTVDGAKHRITLHGEGAAQMALFERKREQAEEAQARAAEALQTLQAAREKLAPEEPEEIATQLAFENLNGAPR